MISETVLMMLFVFIIGSIVGSFLNVCIYRLPRNENIGFSRSRCPHCKKTIRWYDNIPFISYCILKGKCRDCRERISLRYFTVELLTAVLFCILWWKFNGISMCMVMIYCFFVSLLIVGSFIDIEFFILPDSVTVGGMICGLAACAFCPAIIGQDTWYMGAAMSVLGAIVGGGVLYIIAVTASSILKREAMGMGDVKLLAMIGSILGWSWALFTIFSSSFFGTIAGIVLIMNKKTDIKGKIPFGPYLAVGSIVSLLFGKEIIDWYIKLLWM